MRFGPGAFRLVLASAVLLSHLSRWDFGRPAVMLFFMLSGYWVARMQDGPHRLPVPLYIASRWLRIWPAMAITAILVWAVFYGLRLPQPGSLTSTIALLGLATRRNDIVGTIWSLDIEMQFYLLLPIILYAKRLFKSPSDIAILAVASFVTGGAIYLETGAITALIYFPMFAIGISIYLFEMRAGLRISLILTGLGIAVLVLMNEPLFKDLTQIQRDIGFMAASILFSPFVSWNVVQRSGPIDRLLGNLSFPLYLVQEPAIQLTHTLAGSSAFWKPIAVCVCTALTAGLYVFVDRPIEAARHAIFKGREIRYGKPLKS